MFNPVAERGAERVEAMKDESARELVSREVLAFATQRSTADEITDVQHVRGRWPSYRNRSGGLFGFALALS